MVRRTVATASLTTAFVLCAAFLGSACGGGPRAATADLVTIRQPTPDPTLDAVVRDLPRALAGVAAASSTPRPTAPPATLTPARRRP